MSIKRTNRLTNAGSDDYLDLNVDDGEIMLQIDSEDDPIQIAIASRRSSDAVEYMLEMRDLFAMAADVLIEHGYPAPKENDDA